jgi:predicted CoA-binding protein
MSIRILTSSAPSSTGERWQSSDFRPTSCAPEIRGYNVIPVNPRETEILGVKSYPSLSEIPEKVDTVDVFRQPDAVPAIAEEAVAIGAGCLWMQYNVISEEGANIATAGGLYVVMDRCMKVEHARYLGRMHWLGFNTGRITALRGLPT